LRRPVVDDGDAAGEEFCGSGGDHPVDRDEVSEHLLAIPLARRPSAKSAVADEHEHVLMDRSDWFVWSHRCVFAIASPTLATGQGHGR
jgi:hypothetical protein